MWWNFLSCQTRNDSNNVADIFNTILESAYTGKPWKTENIKFIH